MKKSPVFFCEHWKLMGVDLVAPRKLGLYTALLLLLLDQSLKLYLTRLFLSSPEGMIVNGCLNLLPTWNRGVSFSLLNHIGAQGQQVLIIVISGLCLVMIIMLWGAKTRLNALGYGFILGGALGNLIDRYRFGAVFDFIDFHLYNWHFYTFNGADSFITLGVGFLFLDAVLGREENNVKKIFCLIGVVVALGSGCSSLRNTFGLDHYQADSMRSNLNPPLTMPPDFNLRPPKPGAQNPNKVEPAEELQKILLK